MVLLLLLVVNRMMGVLLFVVGTAWVTAAATTCWDTILLGAAA